MYGSARIRGSAPASDVFTSTSRADDKIFSFFS